MNIQVQKNSVQMISQVYLWKRGVETFKCMHTSMSGTHIEVTILRFKAFISHTAFSIAQRVPLIFLVIKVIEMIILFLNMQLNRLQRGFI